MACVTNPQNPDPPVSRAVQFNLIIAVRLYALSVSDLDGGRFDWFLTPLFLLGADPNDLVKF